MEVNRGTLRLRRTVSEKRKKVVPRKRDGIRRKRTRRQKGGFQGCRGWHEMSAAHARMTARVLETVRGVDTWLDQSLGCGESLTHFSKKQISEGYEKALTSC